MTAPVSVVIDVSRNLVMIEYPLFRSACVITRLGNGFPANVTAGNEAAGPPPAVSSPVRVMPESQSEAGVVGSFVDG